ncbi:non-specific serine/threonine protein kinase [Gracilibacillus halophilus YIM-C55.5]|uniref:Non-specific serine/threonine protein kinase n=1 Tax=Gracilibacillus halophilus YIM-C55.5 TaxID=1308866 RepID=N4WGP9_9BACI|nr:DEAD/DEAH box helicase [Gracilibacillus halophilus]ENH98429.1 non-specific serine/threonine protein kinase [Gracilibacillus halophilus YIM-C55.5]
MQKIEMSEDGIRQLTGDTFYERGYDYYKNGRVYGLSYNPNNHSWRGLVKGTKVYTVRLYLGEDMDVDPTCTCPAYDSYGACKHVAAVLLSVTQDISSQRRRYAVDQGNTGETSYETDLFAKQLLHTFRDKGEILEAPKPIQSSFTVKLTQTNKKTQFVLTIAMKVGESRPYIVRDIRGFLQAYKNGESFKVNQSFYYTPNHYYFTSNDRMMIEWLMRCYEQEKLFGNLYIHKTEYPRELFISPTISNELLEDVQHTDYTFQHQDKTYPLIELKEMDDQLLFELDYTNQNMFTFEMTDLSSYRFLDSYQYLVEENRFYQITYEQKNVLEKLFRILPFQSKKKHYISTPEMDSFIENVMPQFEQVGQVSMTDRLKKQINTSPLQAKVYLDEVDEALQASVSFQYGDHVFYPFAHQQTTNQLVKRNRDKENQLIERMRDIGFLEMNQSMFLFDYETIYSFLHEDVYWLESYSHVYMSSDVKRMLGDDAHQLQSSVEYNSSEGMLDISFDVEGISDEYVAEVLQALVEKQRYYRIPNGALLQLDGEGFSSFQQLHDNIQFSKQEIEDGKVELPAARSFQVEDALQSDRDTFSNTFQTMLDQLKHPEELEFPLPEGLDAELRDYQHTGYQWMKTLSHYHLGGILADDMGLGKTLQTITYLLSDIQHQDSTYQALVVAPASLVYNWKKEVEKFAPQLTSGVIVGQKKQRKQLIQEHENTNILITSYPTLRQDHEWYEEKSFDCFILDEAQAIKNHLTLTAKAVRAIRAKQYFALSGTPIENSLDELWSIFHTISPGLFGNKKEFTSLDANYIARITRPFILRRVKKDVLEELPDKIETVQYSELTKQQKEVYIGYLQRIQNEMDETIEQKGFEKGKLQILAGLTRLRQICCHPSLFLENYQGESGKLNQLLELTDDLQAQGKRTLIFSQFSSMLQIIYQALEAQGYPAFYLDGSTPTEKRMEMVEAFNQGEKGFFLISLKAGGTGLNLTGADTVILYDLWWNPAVEEQAAGRAHRIGQEKAVQVIRLITEGTIEEKIYHLQQQKRELVDQIIQPGETLLSKLSEAEIRELLEF